MMKALVDNNRCARATYYQYVEGINGTESEVMMRGKYFEWHVLGATRDGIEPRFTPLTRGTAGDLRPQAQKDLDLLVIYAKGIIEKLGIELEGSQTQLRLETETEVAHIDLLTNDFQKPIRKALYDLKYTETAVDDRWRGWANFDEKWGEHLQAVHYINIYHEIHGEWLPFYFVVFGKTGWVRIIKVEVSESAFSNYEGTKSLSRDRFNQNVARGWPPKPDFNTCRECPYNDMCEHAALLPSIEVFEL